MITTKIQQLKSGVLTSTIPKQLAEIINLNKGNLFIWRLEAGKIIITIKK